MKLRRGLPSLLCAGLLAFAASSPVDAITARGDANNDGLIDSADARAIVEQVLDLANLNGLPDCNDDGTVNVLDTSCVFHLSAMANLAPVADAGPDLGADLELELVIDGVASIDPNGDPLTFTWTLAAKPASSSAMLSDRDQRASLLTPDVAGTYTLSLVVGDGQTTSLPDTVDVIAERSLTTVVTSPAHGEEGVAVTRETILRLGRPLAAAATVSASDLFATYAGETLATRIHVSPDRTAITLFYASPLPPSHGSASPSTATASTMSTVAPSMPTVMVSPVGRSRSTTTR